MKTNEQAMERVKGGGGGIRTDREREREGKREGVERRRKNGLLCVCGGTDMKGRR